MSIRSMDTAEGMELSVSLTDHGVMLTDSTFEPAHMIELTADEAHRLGLWLMEKAVEVEEEVVDADA